MSVSLANSQHMRANSSDRKPGAGIETAGMAGADAELGAGVFEDFEIPQFPSLMLTLG